MGWRASAEKAVKLTGERIVVLESHLSDIHAGEAMRPDPQEELHLMQVWLPLSGDGAAGGYRTPAHL
jgi:hypothetical protein